MTDAPDPGATPASQAGETTPVPDLTAWLRSHKPGSSITLTYESARALHQEMQRLKQSADRLRKQNKKVRRRVDRIKGGGGDEDE